MAALLGIEPSFPALKNGILNTGRKSHETELWQPHQESNLASRVQSPLRARRLRLWLLRPRFDRGNLLVNSQGFYLIELRENGNPDENRTHAS